jgi:hypothetical protein
MFCDFVSNRVVGLLKIGKKKLFLFDDGGIQHELNPLCILDFYIHETRQRQVDDGHGSGVVGGGLDKNDKDKVTILFFDLTFFLFLLIFLNGDLITTTLTLFNVID